MSGFVFLLSWYSISQTEIAKVSTFCFFNFAKRMNSAPPINTKLRGLSGTTLSFFFSTFIPDFCGITFGFFINIMASEMFAILLTPQMLGKTCGSNSCHIFLDSHFNMILYGSAACGFLA